MAGTTRTRYPHAETRSLVAIDQEICDAGAERCPHRVTRRLRRTRRSAARLSRPYLRLDRARTPHESTRRRHRRAPECHDDSRHRSSTRRPRVCGRGSCRWAGTAAVGTPPVGSTGCSSRRTGRAQIASSRNCRKSRVGSFIPNGPPETECGMIVEQLATRHGDGVALDQSPPAFVAEDRQDRARLVVDVRAHPSRRRAPHAVCLPVALDHRAVVADRRRLARSSCPPSS